MRLKLVLILCRQDINNRSSDTSPGPHQLFSAVDQSHSLGCGQRPSQTDRGESSDVFHNCGKFRRWGEIQEV